MSTITNDNIKNISLGDLNLEIKPSNPTISGIDKDIFIKNYGENNDIVTMCFLYNKNLKEHDFVNKFTLKFNTEYIYEGSLLIVGGGGGGGYNIGGGGGGGEVIYIDHITFKGNINYNIVVGKGGAKGESAFFHGDSGNNSGLNDILAKGGGGGASYVYDNPFNLLNEETKLNFPQNDDVEDNILHARRGLDGGSGGGGCGFQYKNTIDRSKYKYGKKTVLKNPISTFENYYSFGNNGGVGNSYSLHERKKLYRVRGGGGGGAGADGEYANTDRNSGRGGDGIAIEEIDIGTRNITFCPLIFNGLNCEKEEIVDVVTKKTTEKLRVKNNTGNVTSLYWGGGGGAGSFNERPGDGGKGGGGGGGYYEEIFSSPEDGYNCQNSTTCEWQRGQIVKNTYITFPNYIINETEHEGRSFGDELTDANKNSDIAKGGYGIPHTGGGGGGGGLLSNGGNGGSGIVIIMLKTKQKKNVVKTAEYTVDDLEKMLSEFDNNKKEFGKNLSELYNYNIKEHKEFYDYILHIYYDNVLEKNILHNVIKHADNSIKKDSEILKYNYDKNIYDVKFHQYLKIIFDLKINYDSFFLYSKIKNTEKFDLNEKLFDYHRLIFIIIDIIENIIILIRNDKNYYEFINNIDILNLVLLNDTRDSYNLKDDLSDLEKDIELIKIKLKETEYELLNVKNKEDQGENTKNEIEKIKRTKQNLEEILNNKKKQKNKKLDNDLYYTYIKQNDNENILNFYISKKNNFKYYDSINKVDKDILSPELFRHYNIDKIKLKELLKYKNIKELIKEEYDEVNDIQLIVKIYIYSLLKIKKQNFLKNILTQYIFMSYANILQNFYKESEEFLLGKNVVDYDKLRVQQLCNITLYNNLGKFDYVVGRMKSLLGYSFVDEYIDGYKINTAKIISLSCPYVKISIDSYDTDKIILLLFRTSINDNLILDCDDDDSECHLKEKLNLIKYKEYYKKLKESFLIEINNNRYNIHDFNFKKKTIENTRIVDTIEFTIHDRYNKICNNIEQRELKDISILSKDSSHINDIYDTDVELLGEYSEKLQNQKKELENIDDKYSKYKYHYEKIKYKNNIYYFVLFLILIVVIILNIADSSSYMKTLTYLIILAVLVILIIYNYFTKVNLSIIEKFEGNKKEELFYDYYNISTATVKSSIQINKDYYKIKFKLSDQDKYKLKIRKFKNLDKNTDEYINNLVKKHLRIKYGRNIEKIENVTIIDTDQHYYYINDITANITFEDNDQIAVDKEIKNIVLVKNDKTVIKQLLSNIDNYIIVPYKEREILCNELLDETELNKNNLQKKNNKRNIYIYTIRNDLLRYINNKFINIKKIIESIELEKANNLANKVHKNLTNEKKKLLNYQKQYESKKFKNMNVNNLYKHEIIGQSAFINFIILFIIILILLLMLTNIFPTKTFIIMIIGFLLICANIYNYVLNSSYRTRKDATKKYW